MSWSLYDAILKEIPSDIQVDDVLQSKWWLVKAGGNVGISMYFTQGAGPAMTLPASIKGMNLRTLAEYIKSWNFYEATVAMAAINAYYNTAEKIEKLKPVFTKASVFDTYKDNVAGKKVAVIGHFPFLEKFGEVCELSILEKNPSEGDYPDSACEYILPEQDYVFVTGTTFANKTLPRLLELSKNARVVMTGPSVPLTEILFDYGVDIIAGTLITDFDSLWKSVGRGDERTIFNHGADMLQIHKS